jgi:hypothetical protein
MDNIWAIIKSRSSNLYMYKPFYEKKKNVYQKYDYGHCTLPLQLVPRFSKVVSNW